MNEFYVYVVYNFQSGWIILRSNNLAHASMNP